MGLKPTLDYRPAPSALYEPETLYNSTLPNTAKVLRIPTHMFLSSRDVFVQVSGRYGHVVAHTAWHSMAEHDTAWHSMAQRGTAWHSITQHGTATRYKKPR